MHRVFNTLRLPVAVVLALALVSGWAQAQSVEGRKPDVYLVSAGVDHYPNANQLAGCLNDALNTTAAFKAQQDGAFGKVFAETLLDGQATLRAIKQQWQAMENRGQAGDVFVLFLSGHGGKNGDGWDFLPFDYNSRNRSGTVLSERDILETADQLVSQGKKVVVIVDACFAGQLRVAAKSYMDRYTDAKGGGLVLMLSSSPEQTSAYLGDYSAFAKAFADSMTSAGDMNRDGKVTLGEIRRFSGPRTAEILERHNNPNRQDVEVVWSKSMSEGMVFAMSDRAVVTERPTPTNPTPVNPGGDQRTWVGTENLPGFGRLNLQLHDGGRVVMTDAAGVREGTYRIVDQFVRMSFDNGRIEYVGVVRGTTMSGSASNDRTTWTWSVQEQGSVRLPNVTRN